MDNNDLFYEFLSNPTVLVAVLIGGSALVLFYILRLFKIEHATAELRDKSELCFFIHLFIIYPQGFFFDSSFFFWLFL